MRFLGRAMMAVLIAIALPVAAQMEETTTSAPEVEVIAHRGASAYAPENTLAAFRKAHEMGADWFELDCTLCKSGEVVVIHDDKVNRTTDGKGKVCDLTLDELKALDAGSWKGEEFAGERIPTLAEALEFAKDKLGVYVEVKSASGDGELRDTIDELGAGLLDTDAEFEQAFIAAAEGSPNLELARAVIEDIRAAGMERQVVVQSFSPIVCAIVAIEAPELKVELLGGGRGAADWELYFRFAFLFDFDGVNTSLRAISEVRLDVIRTGGKSCAVYTVNSPKDMRRLATWGVNRIITDKPDVALKELKAIGKR